MHILNPHDEDRVLEPHLLGLGMAVGLPTDMFKKP